jgi:RNA-directed DNA polymerase
LHEVLDTWFVNEVKPRLKGEAFLIRYADDAVLVFARKEDAERVMEVLPKRFERYGLAIHPEKTRLICFRRPPRRTEKRDPPRWEKFNFLGFTHYWGRSRAGGWAVLRKTELGRFTRALKSIIEWCKRNRHRPVSEQQQILAQKLRGHYAYYGITGNFRCLNSFLWEVQRAWRRWLERRTRGHRLNWDRFCALLQRYPLPPARVVHSCYAAKL